MGRKRFTLMIELRKWELIAVLLAPFLLLGSGALGAWGLSTWFPLPPPDPRAVDEIRAQMSDLRKEMISAVIDGVNLEGCKNKRWELNAEFVPYIVVIGNGCEWVKKSKR